MTLPVFLTNVFYSLALAMNMFVIASGLSLIFGVLRVINFAHGMFYMFGAYIIFTVTKSWGAPFFVGVLAAGAGLALIALVIERFLLRRLYDKEHLMQLLFTFAVVLLMSDVAKMIWGTDQYSVGYPPALRGAVALGPTILPQYLVFLCVAGPLIAVAFGLFPLNRVDGLGGSSSRILRRISSKPTRNSACASSGSLVTSNAPAPGAAPPQISSPGGKRGQT